MKSFIAILALVPLISAHFTLDFPQSRGFNEDIEPQFCGGFNKTMSPRALFPLSGGPITIDSRHPSAQVAILISFDNAPTTFSQFNQTSTGVGYPLLMPYGTITGLGEWCFRVDVAALGVAGVGNGSLATIQVVLNGGDGVLLQCTDVILSSTYTASNVTCANSTSLATSPSTASPVSSAAGSTGTAPSAKVAAAGRIATGSGVVGILLVGMGLLV